MTSKRLQVYETPEITVTFDPTVCRHSGHCIRSLPAVFDVHRKHWIRPELAFLNRPEMLVAKGADKFSAEGELTDEMTRATLIKFLTAFREWALRFRTAG